MEREMTEDEILAGLNLKPEMPDGEILKALAAPNDLVAVLGRIADALECIAGCAVAMTECCRCDDDDEAEH